MVALDADLSKSTYSTYFAKEFPERFFECGIAEANMMAIAAGLDRHPHVWLLTDDIYEHVIFDGRKFTTMLNVAPHLAER